MNSIDSVKDILVSRGISPSFHRLKIYEYLMDHRMHPTADQIYHHIINDIPTLSKTTVYNTMKLFMEKELVQPITIEDNEVRFDADTSMHGHFKCLECGKIYDVSIEQLNLDKKIGSTKKIDGHRITESHLYFRGICKLCSTNN